MTNGEKIQTILNVDRDCTDVHGENGTMTFTVTQDWWNSEYSEYEDIFGTPMKVREAIAILAYGAEYEIKGAYSGKIYHRSWKNKKAHIEQFYDEIVTDSPFYSTIRVNSARGIGEWASPVIGIWMHDYQMCKENEE